MKQMIRLALAAGLLAVVGGALPASAGDDRPELEIRPTLVFDQATGVVEGTFESRGSDFCRKGLASQDSVIEADDHGPTHVAGTDTYVCKNGQGSLAVQFDAVRTHVDGADLTFAMVSCITGGTGRYADLRGVAYGTAWADLGTSTVTAVHPFEELDDDDCPL